MNEYLFQGHMDALVALLRRQYDRVAIMRPSSQDQVTPTLTYDPWIEPNPDLRPHGLTLLYTNLTLRLELGDMKKWYSHNNSGEFHGISINILIWGHDFEVYGHLNYGI